MNNKIIAMTILDQLGGNRFIAMTGAKDFFTNGNDCCFSIPKNASKANRIKIILETDDTYTMEFIKFVSGWFDHKNLIYHDSKVETIKKVKGLFFDQLTDIFTDVTKMYTSL